MSKKPYLILDSNYLCRRSYHSMGNLSYKDLPTGVIYGFLKDVMNLIELFDGVPIFCFDFGLNKRFEIFPDYKKKRNAAKKQLPANEVKALIGLQDQMKLLRKRYLGEIGFRNVLYQKGYESDDIMASTASMLGKIGEEAILITADLDLLQSISPTVSFHDPFKRKTITLQSFFKTYGIKPKQWAKVKAIAGCNTDEVPGIVGVGEKTAIKFLRGELKEDSAAYRAITSSEGRLIIKRNRKLVKLPYEGTKRFKLRQDEVTQESWNKFIKSLGFKSMKDRLSRKILC